MLPDRRLLAIHPAFPTVLLAIMIRSRFNSSLFPSNCRIHRIRPRSSCSPLRRAQDTAFHALDGYAVCVAPYVMESNLAARALSRASHTLAGRVNGSENSALSRAEQWRYQLSGLLHDTQGGYYTHYTQGGYYSFQGGFPRILLFITRGLTVYSKWFYYAFLRGCTCISKALGQVKRAPGRWPED